MSNYRCATCATNDPTRYVRCQLPDCPDGREQLSRDLGRHRPLFTTSDFQRSMVTSDKLAKPMDISGRLDASKIQPGNYVARKALDESPLVAAIAEGRSVQREIKRATVQNERERRFVIYGMIASLSFAIGIVIGSFA